MMLLREHQAHGSLHRAFTHPFPGLLDSADVFVEVLSARPGCPRANGIARSGDRIQDHCRTAASCTEPNGGHRRRVSFFQASSIRIEVSAENILGRRAEPVMYVCCEPSRPGSSRRALQQKLITAVGRPTERNQARWLSRDGPQTTEDRTCLCP